MPHYIVCHRKRNNPRMDIRVCEQKCPAKEDCKEFLAQRDREDASPSPQSQDAELRAA